MGKGSEGKRSSGASAEKKVAVPIKPSPKDEIDAIFAGKKRKTPSDVKKDGDSGSGSITAGTTKKKAKREKEKKRGGPRKKTRDGLRVYTEEELGIGKKDAGGTALCPFDCDCCF